MEEQGVVKDRAASHQAWTMKCCSEFEDEELESGKTGVKCRNGLSSHTFLKKQSDVRTSDMEKRSNSTHSFEQTDTESFETDEWI